MLHRMLPRWAWPLAGVLLAVAGAAWLVAAEVAAQRASFDTDARIAHRLLSQQAVQHDAMLAVLTLLQPAPADAGPGPEQRLPALVPQVLQVLRRGPGQAWPGELPADWAAAEAESATQRQRAVLAASRLGPRPVHCCCRPGSRQPIALRIDATRSCPGPNGRWHRGGPVRPGCSGVTSVGRSSPGAGAAGARVPWRFDRRKRLAADSQPFDLVVQRRLQWADLPWGRVALWCLASALADGGAGRLAAPARRHAARAGAAAPGPGRPAQRAGRTGGRHGA
jgi:hypothetical protein